jgi:hypothetical protein
MTYWASEDKDTLTGDLTQRVMNYYNYLRSSSLYDLYRNSYYNYFKASQHMGNVVWVGQNAEYSNISINHYRNLIQHRLTLTVSQRPTFQPRATNTDYKSQAQVKLAHGLLDYYMREKKLERFIKTAVEFALVYGEGFIRTDWDAQIGEEYGTTENGAIIREGDISFKNGSPMDIIRDPFTRSWQENDWVIMRTFQNKYTLSAKFPEYKDEIENLTFNFNDKLNDIIDFSVYTPSLSLTDMIPVYEFFHRDTAALPGGRMLTFLDNELALIDSPLPYRDIPVYRISAGDMDGTPFGYSVAFDIMPLQQAIDNLYSTIQTNQEMFGVQNILLPRGSNIGLEELGGGLNIIEYDSQLGAPSPLNLTATPVEIFNQINKIEQTMETLSGVNSVARGNPEASLKSGSALALVASQSIQFAQMLQQSYTQLLEDVGTSVINILKDYATVPRIAMISGIANRGYMKEFKGDDLSMINRVIVDMGNPLSQTTSGKVQIAESLIQGGFIKNPEQYIQVLTTGKLDPLIEGEQAELLLIRSENEKLINLERVNAIITDNHMMHIQEHKTVLASPEARENPELVQNALDHIQEHITLLKTGDPDVLQMTGSQPIQSAPINSELLSTQPPVVQAAEEVNMPRMPTNPMTGEQYAIPSEGI